MTLLMETPPAHAPETAILEKLLAGEDLPADFTMLPMDPEIISTTLSKERVRLLVWLKLHGPATSIEHAAEALERHPSALSRDVHALEGLGLILVQKKGRKKRISATGRPILIV